MTNITSHLSFICIAADFSQQSKQHRILCVYIIIFVEFPTFEINKNLKTYIFQGTLHGAVKTCKDNWCHIHRLIWPTPAHCWLLAALPVCPSQLIVGLEELLWRHSWAYFPIALWQTTWIKANSWTDIVNFAQNSTAKNDLKMMSGGETETSPEQTAVSAGDTSCSMQIRPRWNNLIGYMQRVHLPVWPGKTRGREGGREEALSPNRKKMKYSSLFLSLTTEGLLCEGRELKTGEESWVY